MELRVAHDGSVCREILEDRGPCLLSDDLREDGLGGIGAAIFFDARGRLRTDALQRIQGHRVDLLTGALAERTTDARIPTQLVPPRATRLVQLVFELDGRLPIQEAIQEAEPSTTDPMGTTQPTIGLSVFDQVGRSLPLTLHLSRASNTDWRWTLARHVAVSESGPVHAGFASGKPRGSWSSSAGLVPSSSDLPALVIGSDLNGVFFNGPGARMEILDGGEGRLRFDDAGLLAEIAQNDLWLGPAELPIVTLSSTRPGVPDQSFDLDFGRGTSALAEAFEILETTQDGHGPGVITSARVSRNHVVEAVASNGVTIALSELAFGDRGAPRCELACSNGRDDDRDGLRDYPNDPDCASGFDGDEEH